MQQHAHVERRIEEDGKVSLLKQQDLMVVLLRNHSAFVNIRNHLTPQILSKHSVTWLATVWQAACRVYDATKEMPAKADLESEIQELLDKRTEPLGDETVVAIGNFVEYAYSDDTPFGGTEALMSPRRAEAAMKVAARFLKQCLYTDGIRQLTEERALSVRGRELLRSFDTAVARIDSLASPVNTALFGDDWADEPLITLVPTGLGPIDAFTGGGLAAAEVLLFIATINSCKTTTASAIHYEQVKRAAVSSRSHPEVRDVAVFITTEEGKRDFRRRLLMYGAQIPSYRFKNRRMMDLSRNRTPGGDHGTEYERDIFPDKTTFRSEWDRASRVAKLVDRHTLFIDMSSSAANQSALVDVADIEAAMDSYLQHNGDARFTWVTIDHLSALADRINMIRNGGEPKQLTGILNTAPLAIRDNIAGKFQIPAVLMHQFSGQENKKSPAAEFHHAGAKGCSMIAEYVSHVVCSGPTTKDDKQYARWFYTKQRRDPPKPSMVIRLVGDYGRIVEATNVRVEGGGFVDASDYNIVAHAADTGTRMQIQE